MVRANQPMYGEESPNGEFSFKKKNKHETSPEFKRQEDMMFREKPSTIKENTSSSESE